MVKEHKTDGNGCVVYVIESIIGRNSKIESSEYVYQVIDQEHLMFWLPEASKCIHMFLCYVYVHMKFVAL